MSHNCPVGASWKELLSSFRLLWSLKLNFAQEEELRMHLKLFSKCRLNWGWFGSLCLRTIFLSMFYFETVGPFALFGSDPVEGDFVSFCQAALQFIGVWPSVEFESCCEIFVFFSFVFPCEEPGWTADGFLWKIDCVISVDEPVLVGKVGLVKPKDVSVVLAELDEVVEWPFSSGIENFSADFPDVVAQGSVGFESTEPIDGSAADLLDSVIVGDGERLREDLGVNGSLIFEVEPEFSLSGGCEGVTFLGEGLLEVDTSVGWLEVGLDSEQFFMYKIVLQQGVGLFFEASVWLVLVRSCFWHEKDFNLW